MKIFKFGGASVTDAKGVQNVVQIIGKHSKEKLLIIISAMGKTTNALELLCQAYFFKEENVQDLLDKVRSYHTNIIEALFTDKQHPVFTEVHNLFVELEWVLDEEPYGEYDFVYDQIVSIGEMLSSRILSAFLSHSGIKNKWQDVRDCIHTDNNYRQANVNWDKTIASINMVHQNAKAAEDVLVTQGFIGVTSENYTTTLGREGSDYSAAIFAFALNAESVTIWKDVPGVLNADPRYFKEALKLDTLSYQDAVELAYYGATVIHPKTIQPLENKGIPLFVKSFLLPDAHGTRISVEGKTTPNLPSYILKLKQVLISISARDFSFIVEANLSHIFEIFNRHKSSIHLMQHSALSFSVCTDFSERTGDLLQELKNKYKVLYNDGLELLTIRHYDAEAIEKAIIDKDILLEQRSRSTIQMVYRK